MYAFVLEDKADFIASNLTEAGRSPVHVERCDAVPEEPVAVLHFTAPQQGGSAVPGHRDYLGAILGLGLDRAC